MIYVDLLNLEESEKRGMITNDEMVEKRGKLYNHLAEGRKERDSRLEQLRIQHWKK